MKTKLLICASVMILTRCSQATDYTDYCYTADPNPSRLYSVKTGYDVVAPTDDPVEQTIEGCEPVQLYMVIRHGYRFEKDSNIEFGLEKLPEIIQHLKLENTTHGLCDEALNKILAWHPRMEAKDSKALSPTGWREQKEIAKRYQVMFPSLLGNPYSKDDFEFLHTMSSSHRTRDSARAFVEGLFNTTDGIQITETADNWLLKAEDECEKHLELQELPHPSYKAQTKVDDAIAKLNTRLGLPPGELDDDDLKDIYRTCRIEYGLYDESPWCGALTPEMIDVMNYEDDIDTYRETGYTYPLTYQLACQLLGDMMSNFREVANPDKSHTKVVNRFGHSFTIGHLQARLGLFKDDSLLDDAAFPGDFTQNWDRAQHCPFSANMVFAVYSCDGGESYKVQVFLNEEPLKLPACQNEVCDLDELVDSWTPYIVDCDIEAMCATEETSTTETTTEDSSAACIFIAKLLMFSYWFVILSVI